MTNTTLTRRSFSKLIALGTGHVALGPVATGSVSLANSLPVSDEVVKRDIPFEKLRLF